MYLYLQALKLKDREVQNLTGVRDQMDKEIDELSASLFEVGFLFIWKLC